METLLNDFLIQVKGKADKFMNYFLLAYFTSGILLSFFYDTGFIAWSVGGLCLVAYYSAKFLLPGSPLYQYVLSAVTAIFMAQFIYQMHGMFEMHFTAFIGSAILIIYRNWKLQLPLAIVVLLHHSIFGYLQFSGMQNIYFTRLEYMDIGTFIFHVSLSVIIFAICGFWSYVFKITGENSIKKSFHIGKLRETESQNTKLAELAEHLSRSNEQLQAANRELATIFNTVDEVLFSIDVPNKKLVQISKACKSVYGYSREEFMENPCLWIKLLHSADRPLVKKMIRRLNAGLNAFCTHRILTKDQEIHWVEMKLIPTLGHNGKLVRVDGIATNVTRRIKLEKRLMLEKRMKQQQLTAAAITAQENERSFLGEELHDNINPILATAKLYLDCALSDGYVKENLVKDSKGFITTAMTEIRKLSRSLVPPSLGDISLTDAMFDLIEHFKVAHNIRFVTRWNDIDESHLNEKLKLTIYRILQEQMNNIFKHAAASTVFISLHEQEDELEFIISDDGVGFDTGEKRRGVGLQNIISRTELCNGTAVINSSPGMGCQLQIKFAIADHVLEHS